MFHRNPSNRSNNKDDEIDREAERVQIHAKACEVPTTSCRVSRNALGLFELGDHKTVPLHCAHVCSYTAESFEDDPKMLALFQGSGISDAQVVWATFPSRTLSS